MKLFNKCIWHNVNPVLSYEKTRFLGECYDKLIESKYGVCQDCEQTFWRNSVFSDTWSILNPDENRILKSKLYKENGRWWRDPSKFKTSTPPSSEGYESLGKPIRPRPFETGRI